MLFDKPEAEPAIVTATHSGDSNFAIWSLDARGDQLDLLVNTIGPYAGTVLLDIDMTSSIGFEITADGAWSITIEPVLASRLVDPIAGPVAGSGDDVVLFFPQPVGLSVAELTHDGESNFAIWVYSAEEIDLIVNEIGPYNGKVTMPAGAFILEVVADGNWTIAIE